MILKKVPDDSRKSMLKLTANIVNNTENVLNPETMRHFGDILA